MQHNAAFHQGLLCLLRLKQPLGTELDHDLEDSTGVTVTPLMCTMGSSILIVSVVERLSRDRGAAGSSLTGVTVLCP